MSSDEIRPRIKQPISQIRIAGIALERIPDDARFIEDLGLGSSAIIESLFVDEQDLLLRLSDGDMDLKVR